METAHHVKMEGGDNDLLDKLLADSRFHLDKDSLAEILNVRAFVGCAPEQVDAFLAEYVRPVLDENRDFLGADVQVNV